MLRGETLVSPLSRLMTESYETKVLVTLACQDAPMINTSDNRDLLERYLDEYQITSNDKQRQLLLHHLDLVVEKNKVMNLTRIIEDREAIIRHVVDSLLLLGQVQLVADGHERTRFVDVGTGGGFPGIPLGVMTSCQGLLIDSVGKKVNAVNEFIDMLGLSAQLSARQVRAEELAKEERSSFDIVTARAVADLGVLVEYASPLLKRGGKLIVSKAQIQDEEIDRGCKTAKIVGLSLVSRETYELPENQGHREILTFVHDRKSSVKLPRAIGLAKKKPLA